ncbi:MAG: response regulator [Ardenticatenaceae bacterium]|nr:response regulator [Ardenticatenaceae bacterium]
MRERPLILIVDDEPFNVDYLEQELEFMGYDTVSAYDGVEALEKIAAHSPDLALLDIMMPKMDGFQALTHLKADPATRDIPVIIISAISDMNSIVHGIEIGAEDFLPKPFEPVLLAARIKASLQKKVWRDLEKQYLQQIEAEKQRVDELLHVILPDAVVAELKATNGIKPRQFDNVAVLFTDIVGFTPYCDTHSPQEVVANLQLLVEAYEKIAVRHQLQKIKTIGDAFMAAAGLLHPIENPVLACVQSGLEMVTAVNALNLGWQVRVGIHVGPVMAGVVGHRQYLFDLFGDTVNTAQRIESHGRATAVNLSRSAWHWIHNLFEADSLGVIDIKGKGPQEIYCIRGSA